MCVSVLAGERIGGDTALETEGDTVNEGAVGRNEGCFGLLEGGKKCLFDYGVLVVRKGARRIRDQVWRRSLGVSDMIFGGWFREIDLID